MIDANTAQTMISLITQLVAGFLFFGAISTLALAWALKHTAEGSEDEQGFHPKTTGKPAS